MSIKESNLIFDLDGTLFDSAPEILDCLREIFRINNINVNNDFNHSIIGPPLKDTLKSLVQEKDIDKIDRLMSDFIKLYDSKYCYKTQLYKNVRETLEILKREKRLLLITNKRHAPTKIMLENKNIIHFFENYFCVDANDPKKKDKTTLIANTITDLNINPSMKAIFWRDNFFYNGEELNLSTLSVKQHLIIKTLLEELITKRTISIKSISCIKSTHILQILFFLYKQNLVTFKYLSI